jgi:hypothetical protein
MRRLVAMMLVGLLGGWLSTARMPTTVLAQQLGAEENLSLNLPEGVTVTPLASVVIDAIPQSEVEGLALQLMLERVPLHPGSTHDGRDPEQGGEGASFRGDQAARGTHLLYVESGAAVLVMNGREEPLAQGGQKLVPEGGAYELRNDTGECLSVLRLSARMVGGGAGVAASEDVPYVPPVCGEPSVLLRTGGRAIAEQTLLFVARASWTPNAAFGETRAHPGPAGLRLESGTLEVNDREADRFGLSSHIDQDGWLEVRSDHAYNAWNDGVEPATALLVGAIPADEPFWNVPQMRRESRSYGDTLVTG